MTQKISYIICGIIWGITMTNIKWKSVLYIVLAIAIVVFCINWVFSDKNFDFSFVTDSIGKSITTIGIISALFCKYLWKCKLFKKWLVLIPNINGKWKGTIDSNWINGEEIERSDIYSVTLTIKQSLFRVSCALKTDESKSVSFSSTFIIDEEKQEKQLLYSYHNVPNGNILDRSPMHFGTVLLDVNADNSVLTGNYWTSRCTSGKMRFVLENN